MVWTLFFALQHHTPVGVGRQIQTERMVADLDHPLFGLSLS